MFVVGLTGGIASGKSTAGELFSELGVEVIDADHIARELVEPGRPALESIINEFGRSILARDGTLDRARLRTIVFSDPERRRQLEAILHPLVRQAMQAHTQEVSGPYCIHSVPLLLESGQRDMVDRILVIDVPRSVQLARIRARDGMDTAQANTIIDAQIGRLARLAAADDVILNIGDLHALQQQVETLHRRYLDLAQTKK